MDRKLTEKKQKEKKLELAPPTEPPSSGTRARRIIEKTEQLSSIEKKQSQLELAPPTEPPSSGNGALRRNEEARRQSGGATEEVIERKKGKARLQYAPPLEEEKVEIEEEEAEQKKGKTRLQYAPPFEEEKDQIEETTPRSHIQPGAYAISGINEGDRSSIMVDDETGNHHTGQEDENNAPTLVTMAIEDVNLVNPEEEEARIIGNFVDMMVQAEAVQAKTVAEGKDHKKRNMMISLILTILAIAVIVSAILISNNNPKEVLKEVIVINAPTTTPSNSLSPSELPSSTPTKAPTKAWIPLGNKLLAEVASQEFGESVDLSSSGDFLAIGSNSINKNVGQVEVRQYSGLAWRLLGNAIPGSKEGENFGHTVQISQNGKIVIAGGYGADSFDDDSMVNGVVRAYKLNEQSQKWEQFGSEIYGDNAGDRFAVSLSASDDGLSWIAGADNARGPGNERNGYAKVYTLRGDDWVQKGSSIPGLNGERTGYAVAMSGDGGTICVGDRWYEIPDNGRAGRARCFSYRSNNGNWFRKGADIIGTIADAQMGYSLSLNYDGNIVAVGNRFGGDDKEGSIAVFQYSGINWRMMGGEQVGVQRNEQSGFKVTLNKKGDVVAWTARGYNGDGRSTGVVRVARWIDGQWKQVGSDLLGDEANDYFGESVALNADGTIVVGSANWGNEYVRAFVFY